MPETHNPPPVDPNASKTVILVPANDVPAKPSELEFLQKPEILIPVIAAIVATLFGGRGLFDLVLTIIRKKPSSNGDTPQYTIKRDIVSLPARRRDFTTRLELAEQVDRSFGSERSCFLVGAKGTGKTVAAIEAAYRQVDRSNARCPAAFVMVRCFGSGFDLGDFCDSVCTQLDYVSAVGTAMPAKSALTTAFFARAEFMTFCVVDNFEACGAEQRVIFEFLESLPRGVHVLITTTEGPHPWMASATRIRVEGMLEAESIALLRQQISAKNLTQLASAPESDLARLHKATGGNPLAMKWALGEAASEVSFDQLLRRLETVGLKSINQELFGAAWCKTNDSERWLMRMLALSPVPISIGLLVATLGRSETALLREATHLDILGLVEHSSAVGQCLGPTFGLHPLVRAYVTEKCGKAASADLKALARGMLEIFKDHDEKESPALSNEEIRREYDSIRYVIEELPTKQIEIKAALVRVTHESMNLLGQYDDRIRFCEEVAKYFVETNDPVAASEMEYAVAGTYNNKSDPGSARVHAIHSLELASQANDQSSIARALRVKALSEFLLGLDDEAATSVSAALSSATAVNDKECEIEALFVCANLRLARQDAEGVRSFVTQHINVATSIGWARTIGYAYCLLARIEFDEGRLEQAIAAIDRARGIADEFSDSRLSGRLRLLESSLAFKQGNFRQGMEIVKSNLEFLSRLGLQREAEEARSQIVYWSKGLRRALTWFYTGKCKARYSDVRIAGV